MLWNCLRQSRKLAKNDTDNTNPRFFDTCQDAFFKFVASLPIDLNHKYSFQEYTLGGIPPIDNPPSGFTQPTKNEYENLYQADDLMYDILVHST
jgi:hypothetical protein